MLNFQFEDLLNSRDQTQENTDNFVLIKKEGSTLSYMTTFQQHLSDALILVILPD